MYSFKESFKDLEYQKEGAKFALSNKYTVNADEMGLGKTAQGLLCTIGAKKKTLVVAPTYLCYDWHDKIENFTNLKSGYWMGRRSKIPDDLEILSIPYSRLIECEKWFEWADLVIADECQYLKNIESKRSNVFYEHMEKYRPDMYMGLSGTPVKNRIPEIYSQLLLTRLGNPNALDITKKFPDLFTFSYYFTNAVNEGRGVKFKGERNIPELRTYLKNVFIRRLQKNVHPLPEMVNKYVTVQYRENDRLAEIYSRFESDTVGIDSTIKADNAKAKAPFTADYVQGLLHNGEGPIIVFTDHRESLSVLSLALSNFRTQVIHGGVKMEDRADYTRQFQKGMLDVLICTIGSASTGNTFTASNHMVFNDVPWVPADLEQAMKRIHRIGQTKECLFHFITGSTVDKVLTRTIVSKTKTIKKLWGEE